MTVKCNFRKLKLVTNSHGASGTHLILVPGLHELLMKKREKAMGTTRCLSESQDSISTFQSYQRDNRLSSCHGKQMVAPDENLKWQSRVSSWTMQSSRV